MRIAQLTDTFVPVADGVGRVVTAYADTLSNMGHQVTVSSPLYDTGFRGGYPFELVDYLGFKVPTAPQYRTGLAAMDRHYKRRMDMIPLDILHAHSPFGAGMEGLRLTRQRKIPLVATFHSKYYDDFLKVTRSKTISKAMTARVVRFFDRCDDVWAVSQSSGGVLAEYGFKGPIHVMQNGSDIRETTSVAVKEAEEQYQLGGLPVLLFVGQLSWKKNIARILEAAALLKREDPRFRLVLTGQGEDTKDIKRKIETLNLGDQAILTGMITTTRLLDALYKRARLFVFPSLYDNSPMVIREAAAMATPSVVIKGSCSAEAIADGKNGFVCLDETESLYQILKRALLDPALMEQAGIAARNTIPVPWDRVLRDAVKRYEDVIRSHQAKSVR